MHLIGEGAHADRTRKVHPLLNALYSAANNPFTDFFLHEVHHRLLTYHASSRLTMTTGCAVLRFCQELQCGNLCRAWQGHGHSLGRSRYQDVRGRLHAFSSFRATPKHSFSHRCVAAAAQPLIALPESSSDAHEPSDQVSPDNAVEVCT